MEIPNLKDLVDLKDIVSNLGSIALFVLGLFLTTFSSKIKDWLEKKTNEKFEKTINKSSLVRDSLAELRALYGAERVLLFQLHNGQYYFSGEGADKLSLTNFVVDSGIAVPDRAGTRLQNIPVTYWPDTFKVMQDKGFFSWPTSEVRDPFMSQMFAVDGVHHIICGPVKDRRGYWRGVLVVSFMNAAPSEDLDIASEYGQKIGDLLSI